MREWWANVYVYTHVDNGKIADVGLPRPSWDEAEEMSRGAMPVPHNRFRIHVRLKPEGAPRRYAGEANRRAWERDPATAKEFTDRGWPPECLTLFRL